MKQKRFRKGFTLLEAMLVVAIVGIVAVGAGIGLQSVAKLPEQSDLSLAINSVLVDRMEQMRATAFSGLAAKATALSGNVTINGNTYTCTVTAALADADGNGTTDSDFEQVTVTIGTKSLSTYILNP